MLRSIGYQGSPIDGLPYDATTGTVPNARARIVDESGEPITGTYVTGSIKRGPRPGEIDEMLTAGLRGSAPW